MFCRVAEENLSGGNSKSNDSERVERNMFVQELLLSTLTEQLQLATHADDPFLLLDSLRSPEPESERKPAEALGGVVGAAGNVSATAMGTGSSPTTAGREGADGVKNVTTEVQCKSKSGSSSATVMPTAGKSSCSASSLASSSSGRPMPGSASPVVPSVQLEGWNVMAGAAASGSGVGSPPPSHTIPSLRPPLLAAAPPSPPQPQGSTVNLNEHAMSLPPRQAAANVSPRDANRLNPAAAKRSMLKHLPASRGATDMDPPPH